MIKCKKGRRQGAGFPELNGWMVGWTAVMMGCFQRQETQRVSSKPLLPWGGGHTHTNTICPPTSRLRHSQQRKAAKIHTPPSTACIHISYFNIPVHSSLYILEGLEVWGYITSSKPDHTVGGQITGHCIWEKTDRGGDGGKSEIEAEREGERSAGRRELLCVDSYISLLGEIHLLELAWCSSV